MTDAPDDENVIALRPPGGHKRRPGGRTSEGKGKGVSGIPAGGPGYGGPARPDEWKQPGRPGSGDLLRENHSSKFKPDDVAQEALETMVGIMRTSEYEATRLAAAEKVLNRIEGTPIARTIVDRQPIEQHVLDPRRMTPEEQESLRSVLKKVRKE